MAVTEDRILEIERAVAGMDQDVKSHFVELRTFITEQVGELRKLFVALLTQVRALETRMAALETRMAALETRMAALETRMAALEARLSAVETRLDVLDRRAAAIDWKLNWVVIPTLATMAASMAWMAAVLSGLR